ncbi:MAG TPA: hypothetical protein VNT81_11305 [Vicinamibacterales bacterium]|nr:hypothetical protein [Vicinamibacterales bacterium]
MIRLIRSLILLSVALVSVTTFGAETTEARPRPGVHLTPKGFRTPVYGMSRVSRDGQAGVSCQRLSDGQLEAARFSRAVSRGVALRSPRSTVQAVRGGRAFEIIYADAPGTGFNDAREGAVRKRALEAAMNAWALVLDTTIPIVIEARMEAPDSEETRDLLASAGPVDFFDFDEYYVPAALASQLVDEPINEGSSDIEVLFNSEVDWDYATNGAAAPGKASFVYVTIHEIGHGLGFVDSFDPDEGEVMNGLPFPFDLFVNRGSSRDNFLVDRSTREVRSDLISDDLYFNGPGAIEASRRSIVPLPMIKLYAPDPYQAGSSIAHVDQNSYSNFKVGLMTPYDFGSGTDKIDVLTLGILKDMGYRLVPNATVAALPRR